MGRSNYGNSAKGASGSGGEWCQGKGNTAQWECCSNGQDEANEVTEADDLCTSIVRGIKKEFGATGDRRISGDQSRLGDRLSGSLFLNCL